MRLLVPLLEFNQKVNLDYTRPRSVASDAFTDPIQDGLLKLRGQEVEPAKRMNKQFDREAESGRFAA